QIKALDINGHITAVGSYSMANSTFFNAFVWSPSDGVKQLPAGSGVAAEALAINDGGDIVGARVDGNGVMTATWWRADPLAVQPLTGLPTPSRFIDVNNNRMAIGISPVAGPPAPKSAFCYALDTGTITPIGKVDEVAAINDAGIIVGTVDGHATRWSA